MSPRMQAGIIDTFPSSAGNRLCDTCTYIKELRVLAPESSHTMQAGMLTMLQAE